MEFIRGIFIDMTIATCASKRWGLNWGYSLGFLYRLIEFGVVSVIPPIILIETSTKYKTLIAAIASFFGMKFFSKLVEALSEDSIPAQLKKVRESNARLEESNARLEESNARLEESNARLEKTNNSILTAIANLPDKLQDAVNKEIMKVHDETTAKAENQISNLRISLLQEIDLVRPIIYDPYDSPSNGE